jgi:hypothetical protein
MITLVPRSWLVFLGFVRGSPSSLYLYRGHVVRQAPRIAASRGPCFRLDHISQSLLDRSV